MAQNFVEILVKSRDEARPELDDLKAKLQELGREVATARANVDDRDAAAKLDKLQAKLIELDRKTANPNIRVVGALRAEAEIHMVEASMDRLKRKEDELLVRSGAQGLLGRIMLGSNMGGLGSSGGSLGGLAGSAGPSAGMLGGVAALIPVIGAVAVEVLGLASGFAAAGAGAGAFYALAHPAISQLQQDYAGLKSAQAAYDKAQKVAGADPTKSHLKAEHEALIKLQVARKSMKGDEGSAAGGISKLAAEYHKLTSAFKPQAFKIFNDALKIANDLLPSLAPMATAFANALHPLLQQFDKFTHSKGFQDFMKKFTSMIGPAVTAIGEGIGKVVPEIGKLFTLMSKQDVVNAINIAFTVLADTIGVIIYAIRRFMQNWDGMSAAARKGAHEIAQAFDVVRHFIAGAGHDIAQDFDQLRHAAATLGHDIATWFDRIRHDIATWVDDVGRFIGNAVKWFTGLPGRIMTAIGNFGTLLFNAGKALIQGLMNGIKSMFGSLGSLASSIGHFISSLKGPLPADLLLLVPHGQAIMQGLMNGMRSRFPHLRSQLAEVTGIVAGGVNLASIPGWGQIPGMGGQAPVRVQLEWAGGDSPIFQALREGVRVRGGNVQSVLGHG